MTIRPPVRIELAAFGTPVVVSTRVVRVIAGRDDDGHPYHRIARGDRSRHAALDLDDHRQWPGQPIGLDWEAAPGNAFQPEETPTGDRVLVRLRRVRLATPEVGIVIGHTRRQEGRLVGDDEVQLAGPTRTIQLLEVALTPNTNLRKARLVLVHPRDAQRLDQARTA